LKHHEDGSTIELVDERDEWSEHHEADAKVRLNTEQLTSRRISPVNSGTHYVVGRVGHWYGPSKVVVTCCPARQTE
jgi:hypothetical protein